MSEKIKNTERVKAKENSLPRSSASLLSVCTEMEEGRWGKGKWRSKERTGLKAPGGHGVTAQVNFTPSWR